jgi:hypothetical protein
MLAIIGAVIGLRAAESNGFYWTDDYTHLLFSKSVTVDWHALLGVWGRPLMTAVYIPAALLGESVVRMTSLLLLLAAASLTVFAARRWGLPYPWLAAVMLVAQPLTATLGFAALPQILFSAVLAGAFALRSAGRHLASVIVISFLPLARVEGIAVLVVWAIVLILERRHRLVPLLASALVAWELCTTIVYSDPLWLYHDNPYGILGSQYGAAGFGYGFIALALAFGAVVTALALAAIPRVRDVDLAVSLTAGGLFVLYVAAWTLPAFQTIRTPAYLVSLSVPVALLAHRGAVQALSPFRERRSRLVVAVAATICVAAATRNHGVWIPVAGLLALGIVKRSTSTRLQAAAVVVAACAVTLVGVRHIEALRLTGADRSLSELAQRLGPRTRRVVWSSDPAFSWYAGRWLSTRTATALWSQAAYAEADRSVVGSYVVWEGQFGPAVSSLRSLRQRGYTVVSSSGQSIQRVVLLERTRA